MTYRFQKSAWAAGLLVVSMLLVGCGDGQKALASSKEELTPVMTVGEYDVPFELYRYVALNYKNQYETGLDDTAAAELWLGESGKVLLAELQEDTQDTILRLYATMSLAAQYNLTPDSALINETVATRMDEIYEGYDNDYDAYRESLEPYFMNDSVYRFLVQDQVLTEELFYAMLNKGEIISDEDALEDMIHSDNFIRVKQILIAADNGETDADNRAKAQSILAKLDSGADFEKLLNEHGEDLYMFNNPDGYYICAGNRYAAFEEAAFALDIGEYSDVVQTEAGYSILMRYEKEERYLTVHFDDLCQEYFDSAYNALVQAHLETLNAVTLPALDDTTIFTME